VRSHIRILALNALAADSNGMDSILKRQLTVSWKHFVRALNERVRFADEDVCVAVFETCSKKLKKV
jgi:hypothetical protein